jgi:xanthine dehydrogenase molybdopterin-binding subunit B
MPELFGVACAARTSAIDDIPWPRGWLHAQALRAGKALAQILHVRFDRSACTLRVVRRRND